MSKGAMRAGQILALLAAILLLWAGERLIPLPDPSDTPGTFSATRATERLSRVLGEQRPHPVDSAANDLVRDRIVRELRALGLRPQVDDGWSCNGARRGALACARVRNIRATLGDPNGRHLLVVSHYDGTPAGPGAADDGIGIAAMLETAALLSRRTLARPVTFLFNEGEEVGLLGARAFLSRDPLAPRVDALVNLEARGVEGPAIMFETSRPNAAAVRWLARSGAEPVANSLATDFYRLIPNSTDVRVFGERPWTILNLAIIGNETRYHSPGDRVEGLSRRSVQHMGDQLLAIASAWAASGVAEEKGTRVFADLWGWRLVHVPATLAFALLGAGALLLAIAAWRARAWRGVAVTLGAMLLAGGLAFALLRLMGSLRAGEYWRAQPNLMSLALIATALLAAAIALSLAYRGEASRMRAGFWFTLALIGAGVSAVAPGASIFFALPPLLAAAGLLIGGRAERPLVWGAAALLLLSWAPLVGLIEVLLDFDNGWIFAPLYALLLVPVLIEVRRARPAWIAGAGAPIAWIVVALVPAYSGERRQMFGIEYAEAPRSARWLVVNDGAPLPPAFRGFRPGLEVVWSGRPRWAVPAPPTLLPLPELELLGSTPLRDGRRVRLRLTPIGGQTLALYAPLGSILAIHGPTASERFRPARPAQNDVLAPFFTCHGRSCEGLVIDVELAGTAPITVEAVSVGPGLPANAAPFLAARPAHAAPQYSPDATVRTGRVTL